MDRSITPVRNLFAAIPEVLPDELVETLASSGSVRIERIISKGHITPEGSWYDQEEHEFVVLLKGEGHVLYESGEVFRLLPGDCLNIPAHQKHRVTYTMPDGDTVWLAVFYS